MFATPTKVAATVSLLLECPLIVLELTRNWSAGIRVQDFIALFGFLWLIGFAIVLTFLLVANRSKFRMLNRTAAVVASFFIVVALTFVWLSVVADQAPCFLGIPNCD